MKNSLLRIFMMLSVVVALLVYHGLNEVKVLGNYIEVEITTNCEAVPLNFGVKLTKTYLNETKSAYNYDSISEDVEEDLSAIFLNGANQVKNFQER